MSTSEPNYLGNPIGTEYDPSGDMLSLEEAVNRIDALMRRAQEDCYLPEYPEVNHRNAGRVRALAQALRLLERAGLEPTKELVVTDDEDIEEAEQ